MKNFIFVFLLGGILILAACSSKNQDSLINATDSETKNIEAAKADLSASEFDKAIEESNQATAKLNNDEVVNSFEGATYEAYLLTRANLSKEHYEKAQEQNIFASGLTYDEYKGISDGLVNREEYEEEMFGDNEEYVEFAYGAYAAKTVQYLTPLSSVNQ